MADWSAPVFLTSAELQTLDDQIQKAQSTTRQIVIDWRELVAMDAAYWAEFERTLANLAELPLRCKMHGVAALEQVFSDATPAAMLAKLAFLRCQNKAQQFEDVAMDYCVKFEVSPPDWVLPKCRFEETQLQLAPRAVIADAQIPTELYGVLEGAHAAQLLTALTPVDGLVIRCDRLVRCDAESGSKLVKWAQIAVERFGCRVEFYGVHRLIESYLIAQGMSTYAKITLRKD
jgi:hypothetical protein